MSVGSGITKLPTKTRVLRHKGSGMKSRLEQREAALKKQREAFNLAIHAQSPPAGGKGRK